jgi:hypothetical protein
MPKRTFIDMINQSEEASYISGYKDGKKLLKLFKKDVNFNIKHYIDGLYNSYVNILQLSYNCDLPQEQEGFSFCQSKDTEPTYINQKTVVEPQVAPTSGFCLKPFIEVPPYGFGFGFGSDFELPIAPSFTNSGGFDFGKTTVDGHQVTLPSFERRVAPLIPADQQLSFGPKKPEPKVINLDPKNLNLF